MQRATIGVFPPEAADRHAPLFAVLSDAFGVQFVDGGTDHAALAAAIVAGDGAAPLGIPTLVIGSRDDAVPVAPSTDAVRTEARAAPVVLTDDPAVDVRLRGVALDEFGAFEVSPLDVPPGGRVLATGPNGPVWVTDGDTVSWCAAVMPRLVGNDRLKDHLRTGRFLALTAITHLLRAVNGYDGWERPRARANITIDDPNLRTQSYGFVRFEPLAEHARRVDYHVDIAIVPADAGGVHASTAALFRDSEHLGLVVHGNDHLRAELAQDDPEHALAVAAQSLRRIAAFEARNGLRVGRVMVPPHGVCSQAAMDAARRVGFEAMSYRGPRDRDALSCWLPADLHLGGGIPGMPRVSLKCPTAELALRSFLDQPMSLCGHHDDLAGGFGSLEAAVERVRAVAPVTWMSLPDMARSNFWHRHDGTTLHVRLFTRHAVVAVPPGIENVVVEPQPGGEQPIVRQTTADQVQVVVPEARPCTPDSVSPPPWRPWPIVRRVSVRGRDRLLPLVRRRRIA